MALADDIRTKPITQATELVRRQLLTDNQWLVRGLVAIFNRQTSDEQTSEFTRYHNSIGFNSADGEILTSIAKQWLSRNWLSRRQLAIVRKKLPKYSKQLVLVARHPAQEVA